MVIDLFLYGKNILGVYCAVLIIAFPTHFVCDFKNCGVKRMGRDVNQTTKKYKKKSDLVTTKPQQQSIQIHMTYINPKKRFIVSSMEVELE